jgi:S-adenosylmethionine:tRNA ribosyltransferase-isomerase
MDISLFDFHLPESHIALRPAPKRDEARMLVVQPRTSPTLTDTHVNHLTDWLRPGDALVLNNTKVIPARLYGVRIRDGVEARIEVLLHMRLDGAQWKAFARPAKKLQVGDALLFSHLSAGLHARVIHKGVEGEVTLHFALSGPELDRALIAHGELPLPPYIAGKREVDSADTHDYQTVYARHEGAVAAPTAGLHFTPELFSAIEAHGVSSHFVTLHVGAGTFLPVKAEDTDDHIMHAEWGEIDPATATALNEVRARGGRLIAVGTTSLRLLESAATDKGQILPFQGATDIFITPGYRFKTADLLMTNFHLPKSTLFMLVSAFCGLSAMKEAYAHAIASDYRFYSYGDSSLLFRA